MLPRCLSVASHAASTLGSFRIVWANSDSPTEGSVFSQFSRLGSPPATRVLLASHIAAYSSAMETWKRPGLSVFNVTANPYFWTDRMLDGVCSREYLQRPNY